MSVGHLARILEGEGIATVVIATEVFEKRLTSMTLPRLLLTPYPMGRPLGFPRQENEHKLILMQALKLLEGSKGLTVHYWKKQSGNMSSAESKEILVE